MKVGFVGGGKMAEAIIGGLIRSNTVSPDDCYVSEIDASRRGLLHSKFGICVSETITETLASLDVLFLAVKPQNLDDAVSPIAAHVPDGLVVISIAAGKTLRSLSDLVPQARIIRVMPNLPVLVSCGMSVFCTDQPLTDSERDVVTSLLSCCGKVLELPEEYFDAVTALSGSGPAFFAYFLEAMTAAGEAAGLPPHASQVLGLQTMLGTARLLDEKEIAPSDLITSVTSKKGTTEAGLKELTQPALKQIIAATLNAAANRSAELSA